MPALSRRILLFINTGQPFTHRQIEKAISPETKRKNSKKIRRGSGTRESVPLNTVLRELVSIGYLAKNKKTYRRNHLLSGRVKINTSGNGILVTDTDDEIQIEKGYLKDIYNGDKAEAEIIDYAEGAFFGKITRILERQKEKYFARLTWKTKKHLYFTLLDAYNKEVCAEILPGKEADQEAGDFAIVRLTGGFIAGKQGSVAEKFYKSGERFDVERIIVRHNLPGNHADYCELENINSIIEKEEPGRKNYCSLFTVTIDGEKAKDFDDAVSIEKSDNGYKLYVHIADVSAFVKKDSALDREALKRGNSYYLGNSVIPMLPEILSNDLCSLKEGEKRLTLSAEIVFDKSGNEISADFFRGIIKSDSRLTYNLVDKMISDDEPDSLTGILKIMRDLAVILKRKRLAQGRIDLNLPDYDLVYEGNEVSEILFAKRLVSHMIIEEFMLSANECVSRALKRKNVPALYRIHEPINKDKLAVLKQFLKSIGITLKETGNTGLALQKVIDQVNGKKFEKVVNFIILKSFMQAFYGPEPLGHFGLGFTDYTHFTSPIRRYPDLVVHRCLKSLLMNEGRIYSKEELETIGRLSSETERTAQSAERDLFKLVSCRFMENKTGEVFDVIVSGISKFGFFVMLTERPVEGMVPLRNLANDYYMVNEDEYSITGTRTGKRYRIGDTLRARLVDVDYFTMRIDFEPV